MGAVLNSRPRRRLAWLALLLTVVAAFAGAGMWAGGAGPFARPMVPATYYVYLPGETDAPATTATAESSATADVSASATATAAAATATAPAATPTAFHPPVATLVKPNLVHVSHTTPNVVCDVPFTMYVTIRNAGPVAAGPNNVFVFDSYTDTSYHPVAGDGEAVSGLPAGASVTIPFTLTVSEYCGRAHDHDVLIRIDGAESVDESDELDNYVRFTQAVRAPNLYLTDLYIPPSPPCNAVNVGVRINNNGTVATHSGGRLRFTDTVGGHPSYTRNMYADFPAIPAGTSRIVNVTWAPLQYCGHLHTMTVLVDSNGVIGESSETDNTATRQFVPEL